MKNPAVIVAVLLVFGGAALIIFGGMNFSIAGFSALSISKAEFISNDPFYGNALHLVAVADGSSNQGAITFSPDQAVQYGLSISEPISIEMEQTCKYMLKNKSSIISSFSVSRQGHSWDCSCPSFPKTCTNMVTIGNGRPACYLDYCSGWNGDCIQLTQDVQGVAYELDSVTFLDVDVRVKLGSGAYNLTLTQNQKSAASGPVRAALVGSLMGAQSCPALSAEAIALIPANATTITLREKRYYSQYTNSVASYMGNPRLFVENNAYLNNVVQTLQSSSAYSQYCTIVAGDAYTASIKCRPDSPVAIPVLDIYIRGSELELTKFVGKPVILDVSASKALAGTKSQVTMTVKNDAQVTAAFDLSVQCSKDVNPFSVRETFAAGETKTVSVPYEGSGMIATCNVLAQDVNNPSSSSAQSVRLEIEPICARAGMNSQQVKVNTEYGCAFICPNQYTDDVNHYTCEVLGPDYTRCDDLGEDGNCKHTREYEGYHCTGMGKYATTNSYIDLVARGKIQPFIPEQKPHMVFLNVPYCGYVNEYGYQNGVELADVLFNAEKLPTAGTYQEYVMKETLDAPVLEGESDRVPADLDAKTNSPETNYLPFAAGALILIAGVGIYLKKRG